MRIRFWGTRGSIPTPGQRTVRYGGNTACVEVRDDSGHLLILDAGTGLRELGLSLNGDGPHTVDLLISHLHWDHIQGIPFFQPAYDPHTTLRLYGPEQQRPLRELLGLGMDDPFFPVDLDAIPAQLEIHEVPNGTARSIGPYAVRATKRADTLIHDGQFLDGDYKPGWGHSTVSSALDVALRSKVKRLVLYHHDPERSDDALDRIGAETQRAADEQGGGLEVVVAREGLELAI